MDAQAIYMYQRNPNEQGPNSPQLPKNGGNGNNGGPQRPTGTTLLVRSLIIIGVVLLGWYLFQYFFSQNSSNNNQNVIEVPYSTFYQQVEADNVLVSVLINFLPWIFLIGVFLFIARRATQGQQNIFSFGKSKAKVVLEDKPSTTFADVAGVDEAKNDLVEVVDFLKTPTKFQRLGGKIPRGILMVGPPGTGKTLLARAVAGEAGVPFFSMSGSEFVEVLVGVGASRVRDLFDQAKKASP